MIDFEKLAQNMGNLEEDLMKEQLQQVMDEGGQDAEKALEACQQGMAIVGDLFESGDWTNGRGGSTWSCCKPPPSRNSATWSTCTNPPMD